MSDKVKMKIKLAEIYLSVASTEDEGEHVYILRHEKHMDEPLFIDDGTFEYRLYELLTKLWRENRGYAELEK